MDRNLDCSMYGGGFSPYMSSMGNDMNMESNNYDANMFNPMSQYEQGYMYYRYLCQQLDYKIKCKEYDRLCGNIPNKNDRKLE